MLRKIFAVSGLAVMLCTLCTCIDVFAMGHCHSEKCVNYADTDGDGICDNYGMRKCRNDADRDGICDNYGMRKCRNDADGDGICDNYGIVKHHNRGKGHNRCAGR